MNRTYTVKQLTDFLVKSVDSAQGVAVPFYHLELKKVFPDDLYAAIIDALPDTADYRPMSGGGRVIRPDGTPARVKIDLFPDEIRHLPERISPIWKLVGGALRSKELQSAFSRRLANQLEYRFKREAAGLNFYPVPCLTRDLPGYSLRKHPDTASKGITVQFYLPHDDSISNIGTIFYQTSSSGEQTRSKQMAFLPNTGYAFAVVPKDQVFAAEQQTWHSVDLLGGDADLRNSILLTYYVHTGRQSVLNYLKRSGNWVKGTGKLVLKKLGR